MKQRRICKGSGKNVPAFMKQLSRGGLDGQEVVHTGKCPRCGQPHQLFTYNDCWYPAQSDIPLHLVVVDA